MTILLRILKLYAPEKGWLLLGIFLGVVTAGASIALLAISGWFIAAMGIAGVTGAAINYFTPAAVIRTLAIGRTAGRYGERMLTHKGALQITARTRNWLYGHIERLPTARLMHLHSGDLFGRLRGDIEILEKFYLGSMVPFTVALLTLLPILVYLAFWLPWVAACLTLQLLLAAIAIPLWVERRSRPWQQDISTMTTALRMQAGESWQAATEMMIYGHSELAVTVLDNLSAHITQAQLRQQRIALVGQGGAGFLAALAGFSVLPLIAAQIASHELAGPDAAMLPLLAMACFDIALPLATALQLWQGVKLAARRIFTLVDEVPAIAPSLPVPDKPFQLEVSHVSFAHRAGQPLFNDLNVALQAGQALAITGPSGIGKSTMIRLLTGLYQPDQGVVTLNAIASVNADGEDWRRHFSVAEQRLHIFAGTLRRNLLLGNPSADDDQLMEACRLAGLTDDIAAMPAGLDTFVGELGVGLSGGQARRLSLARALLKPASCLILDEPTDGLDAQAGPTIIQAILNEARQRNMAVIIVTHDPRIAALCEKSLSL